MATQSTLKNRIIATTTDRDEEIAWNSGDLISVFLLKNYNKKGDAERVMKELEINNPNSPGTRWSVAIFNADYDTAGRIASENPYAMHIQSDQSFPILLRLHNECGVFYVQ